MDRVFAKLKPAWLAVIVLGGSLIGIVCWRAAQPAVPRHVRIGLDPAPPYSDMVNGRPEGLVVEILSEAARRRGITLEWVGVLKGADHSLDNDLADLWATTVATREWKRQFYVSKPWLRNSFYMISPADRPVAASGGLDGKVLSIVDGPSTKACARRYYPNAIPLIAPSRMDAMLRFCRGQADFVLVEMRLLQSVLLSRPEPCARRPLRIIRVRGAEMELGIGSTKAMAPVADQLRSEIDNLRADGTVGRALDTWCPLLANEAEILFKEQDARRSRTAYLSGLALAIIAGAVMLWAYRNASVARRMAESASLAKSEFVANISHEIRTPLAGILSTAELLAGTRLNTEQAEYANVINQSGGTLLALLNSVLDIKKVEAGKLEISSLPFDLAQLLAETVNTFRASAEQKGLSLTVEGLEALPPRVAGDGLRIREVVANLLGNAVKFTHAGWIRIGCDWTPGDPMGRLRLSIADSGIGLPEGAEQHLFQKFTQADSSIGKRYGGTGLGLALARELVALMGGKIGCNRPPDGDGSEFWFEIPLAQAPEIAERPSPKPPGEPVPDSPAAASPHLLLVDDNAVNRLVACRFLMRCGCTVDEAANGQEALEKIRSHRYDAILMDCFMPDMDGYEATRKLRASEPAGCHIPVIALTAAAFVSDRDKAIAAGMDDFLAKPIQSQELARVLDQWVFSTRITSQS